MQLLFVIVVHSLVGVGLGQLLWRWRKSARLTRMQAAIIDDLHAQLHACQVVMHCQSSAIYDLSVQLHGKEQTDRAIREAHERGTN